MFHVAQISFYVDPQGREPDQILRDWWTLVDVADAAAVGGARVSVIHASVRAETLVRNGVQYHFLPVASGSMARSPAFSALLRSLAPDVVHVHGLSFPADVLALAEHLPSTPILLQDHANRPPHIWRRRLWRRGLSMASGISFCATDQARPFTEHALIAPRTQLFEIPESTSRFMPGDRSAAREATGVHGNPALLWIGHLDENKDPLAVLKGVSLAARELPDLQLWCCFVLAPLMAQVKTAIERDPLLHGRVHLLGRVPHERIELLLRAADLFVLGSHREGSGYSLIEALACGLPPVVTDIPSFRALTGAGAVGRLWPPGDSRRLGEALLWMAADTTPQARAAVRAHFDAEVSLEAVGRKLMRAYGCLVAQRSRRQARSG